MNWMVTAYVVIYMDAERRGGRRRWWRVAARFGVTAALLVVLGVRIGGAAFARGVSSLTVPVIGAAVAATALSTLCAAWRWWVVARQLGAPLPTGRAVAAYYRSQFLNSVLPGGVVGDAHRAVAHGRDVDDVGRAARAVVWERGAGQVVQALVTIAVLAIMPSPGRWLVPVLVVALGCAFVTTWYIWRGRRRGSSWIARVVDIVRSDLRDVLRRPVWPVLMVASVGVVVSHVALYVLVAHTVDPTASVRALVPVAVIVEIAAGVPLSVGGWGLREGAAGWAFAAAGLGAATGIAASVAYGVVSLIALAPGAIVLGIDLVRGRRPSRSRRSRAGSPVGNQVALHG